jgi:hypothetical protein
MKAAVKPSNSAQAYAEFLKVAGEAPFNNNYVLVLQTLRRGLKVSADRVKPTSAGEVVSLRAANLITQTEGRRYLGLSRSRQAKNAPSKREVRL